MGMEAEARAYFEQHYNCAQSVFAPFAIKYGMDLDTALKIATPFGGGMGHAGQTCGAVCGALLAIGLSRGIAVYDKDQKDACYAIAGAFQAKFKEIHGDLICPNLLGMDIGDPVMLQQAREEQVFKKICPQFVGDAARIVSQLLENK